MAIWRSDILEALLSLGGAGTYDEIYAEVAARRTGLPKAWQEIIRRTIQEASTDSAAYRPGSEDLFYSVEGIGHGVWGLRALQPGVSGIAENPETGQGFVANSKVKIAIERYAVEAAIDYYNEKGALEIIELGKPYDLRVVLLDQELHVEVKGSTRKLSSVTLTRNEVSHAQTYPGTQLFVLDEMKLTTDQDGTIAITGGRKRIWENWVPATSSLQVVAYSHMLA